MRDINNIYSLSDFSRNAEVHVERLKASGEPEVLTINGKAELVVQDVVSYQALLKKAVFADTAAAIRRGIKARARGDGKNMRKALEAIAQKTGFELN